MPAGNYFHSIHTIFAKSVLIHDLELVQHDVDFYQSYY